MTAPPPRRTASWLARYRSLKVPFWKRVGMRVEEASPGEAAVRVPYDAGLRNANGVVHGGVVFAAADSAIAIALLGLIENRAPIATIELKINFLRPVDGEDLLARARIIHCGRRTAVGEATVFDGSGRAVARALATYAIASAPSRRPPPAPRASAPGKTRR